MIKVSYRKHCWNFNVNYYCQSFWKASKLWQNRDVFILVQNLNIFYSTSCLFEFWMESDNVDFLKFSWFMCSNSLAQWSVTKRLLFSSRCSSNQQIPKLLHKNPWLVFVLKIKGIKKAVIIHRIEEHWRELHSF